MAPSQPHPRSLSQPAPGEAIAEDLARLNRAWRCICILWCVRAAFVAALVAVLVTLAVHP